MPQRLNEIHYERRKRKSDVYTHHIVKALIEVNGHITAARMSTRNQDIDEAVDYFFTYPEDADHSVPNQFKIRMDHHQDCPVCVKQPFYGVDAQRAEEMGRDWRGLFDYRVSRRYYVAYRNPQSGLYEGVYWIPTTKLRELVKTAWDEWMECPEARSDSDDVVNLGYFTESTVNRWKENWRLRNKNVFTASNGAQIWFKHNPKSEKNFSKFMMFVPKGYAHQNIELPPEWARETEQLVAREMGHNPDEAHLTQQQLRRRRTLELDRLG